MKTLPNEYWYAAYAKNEERLRPIVERAIDSVLRGEAGQQPPIHAHLFYGVIGADPQHLVIWYLFKTDREKEMSDSSGQMKRLVDHTRSALKDSKYPSHSFRQERICFASEEQIQKAGGHRQFFRMRWVILTVVERFQVDGHGTVVTGHRGDAWPKARRGAEIELRAPSGQCIRTRIRELEAFRTCFSPDAPPSGGISFEDKVTAEQVPSGTEIVEVTQ